jgi:hypothetical protein
LVNSSLKGVLKEQNKALDLSSFHWAILPNGKQIWGHRYMAHFFPLSSLKISSVIIKFPSQFTQIKRKYFDRNFWFGCLPKQWISESDRWHNECAAVIVPGPGTLLCHEKRMSAHLHWWTTGYWWLCTLDMLLLLLRTFI